MAGSGITISETARALVRTGFFGADFDSNVEEIRAFQSLRFGASVANNIFATDQGRAEIEMMAFALSTGNWYGDRQAGDTTLKNVRLRAAAVTIARQLGYTARSSVPPAVSISMTLAVSPPSRLTIEKGRKLNGPGDLSFETAQQVIFDIGEVGPKVFAAREGKSLEETFTSTGEPNQVFKITTIPGGMAIAQDSVQSFVAEVAWTANEVLLFEQTNQFEFEYGFDPPRAVFGNGVAGNIPPKDAAIRIRFFVTDGTAGTVAAGAVTSFAQPLTVGTTTLAATLVQSEPSSPGSDPESIASIATNAPQVFQSAGRAVTQLDLDGLINSFIDSTWGAVAIGRATVPRSVDQDAEALSVIQDMVNANVPADTVQRLRDYWNTVLASNCEANVVLAQILAADLLGRYIPASVGLARALETFLQARTESTVRVHVADGSINLLSVDLAIEVHPLLDFSSQEAQQTIVASVVQVAEDSLLDEPELHLGADIVVPDLGPLRPGRGRGRGGLHVHPSVQPAGPGRRERGRCRVGF